MLSKKTVYALHALTFLARRHGDGPILISEVSDTCKIPKKFLENILLELKNIGILSSKKGKGGGYYLIKEPEDITLAKIIRMFNGPIALVPCVSLNFYEKCDSCMSENVCGLNKIMIEVRDETLKILENSSLRDVLDNDEKFL
ncbi:RrF2 family transcriptional regulator [Sediminitomix flava]|uniref:BadM/Rrf2 family transcriptional regulator n=1 Tax=Sediminitomix flava TaxID=379075 RepID=A0A315ZH70_SEDFL|nr:Rrf2 family transcriptional regulator [Sediminitomix flava]PWJ44529.1 BadM/Rrf2 family transcriptional regulator [Sediminitomix flava]